MAEFKFPLPKGAVEKPTIEPDYAFPLPVEEEDEGFQFFPDEEFLDKYAYPALGIPMLDVLRPVVAPINYTVADVWDYTRGQVQQLLMGMTDFNMPYWQQMDEIAESSANWVNEIGATWNRLTDPTQFGQIAPVERPPELIKATDFFKDRYIDAYIYSAAVETNTLAEKVVRTVGHTIPTVMEMAAFRKFSVERGAALGVKIRGSEQLGQTAVGVGSMFTYGGFKAGIGGAMDLAALDMLNIILGGFSWPVRVAGLSTYMAQQASLHGETGNDVVAQGILGGMFGMVGKAARGQFEREMTMLLKKPIIDWLEKQPIQDFLGKSKLSPALKKIIAERGAKYHQDHRPGTFEAARVGEVGNFPEPFSSPMRQITEFLHKELGESQGLGKYLEGSSKDVISKATLMRAWEKFLRSQKADPHHLMSAPERTASAESLAEASFDAHNLWFSRKGKIPAEVLEKLPLGQESTEAPEVRARRIEQEQPVDVMRKGGLTRTTMRAVKLGKQIVTMPDGEPVSVPLESKQHAGRVQSLLDRIKGSKEQLRRHGLARVSTLRSTLSALQTHAFDQQYLLKSRLEGLGPKGRETVLLMETTLNAPKAVQHRVARVANAIMGSLTKAEGEKLDIGIYAISAAHTLRRAKAAGKRFGYGEYQPADYDTLYQTTIESIPVERRGVFQGAVDTYFYEVGEAKLERMHARRLIGDSDLVNMRKLKYSPMLYMEALEKIMGKDESILSPLGVSTSGVKELGEGSATLPVHSHLALGLGSIAHFEARMYKNDVRQSLARTADAVDTDLVRRAIPDKEGVVHVPEGYSQVDYMDAGVKRSLIMPREYAKALEIDPGFGANLKMWHHLALGTPLVKTLATVANPEFALAAFPRDLAYIWLVDSGNTGYSELLPIAAMQLGYDVARVLPDVLASKLPAKVKAKLPAFLPKGEGVESFVEGAGGFTLYGMYAHTATLGYGYRALFGQKAGPARKAYYKTLQAFASITEIGELTMRRAYMERLVKNGMSPKEAAMTAMAKLNFARKGTTMQWLDVGIPYANAAAQAFDNLTKSAIADPAKFEAKILQMVGVNAGLYMTNLMTNPEGWEAVSNRERINNYVIMLGRGARLIDHRGNVRHMYIAVKKENFVLYTMFDAAVMGALDKAYFGREIGPYLIEAMKASLPYNPGRVPPMVDAIFAAGGLDTFWMDKIYKGKPVEPEAEYTAGVPDPYVHIAHSRIGRWLGISPKRMKAMVDKMVPNNLAMGTLGFIAETSPAPIRDDLNIAMWAEMPMLRRLVSLTTPMAQEGEQLDAAYRRANTKEFFRVKEPAVQMMIDLKNGSKTRQEIEAMLVSGEGEYFHPDMTDFDRISIANTYKAYVKTETLYQRLEENNPDLRFDIQRSPFWFARIAAIGGEDAAMEYFEDWRNLPGDIRRKFEALAEAAGILSGKEARAAFNQMNQERGLSFRGEEE